MEELILTGLIPFDLTDRDEVQQCRLRLLEIQSKSISFEDKVANLILKAIIQFYNATKTFFDQDQLSDILKDSGIEPELMSKALFLFEVLKNKQITNEKYAYTLDRFLEYRKKNKFEEALLNSLNFLKGSGDLDTGVSALQKAKEAIIPVVFDSEMASLETPHGNILQDKDEILDEIEKARSGKLEEGLVPFGYVKMDKPTGGLHRGDLAVVAGISGTGKSFFGANLAYNAAFKSKKNVCIVTLETTRKQIRRRILSRHSTELKFGSPISIEKLKAGDLSEEEYETLKMVLEDMSEGDYGTVDVVQPSNNSTIEDIRIYLEKLNMVTPLDLVIIDYLTLLKPVKRTNNERADMASLFKECKQLALTFNKGKGIPIVTVHQISFQATKSVKFEPGKFFKFDALADTSEAVKSSDFVMALYRDEVLEEAFELAAGILKTRDGTPADENLFKLYADFRYGLIADLQE